MNLLCTNRSKPSVAAEYATSADFRRLFTEGMVGLYLLSCLLTGNLEKAEHCFVAGIEDLVKSSSVFKEWARSWTRRAIVQNAIRMMAPRPNYTARTIGSPDPWDKIQGTPRNKCGNRIRAGIGRLRAVCFCRVGPRAIFRSGLFFALKLFARASQGGTNACSTAEISRASPQKCWIWVAGRYGSCL